tara:strand:- start:2763 stop:2999 length:237 start_codon:yes stop_codon:yes gene_type:complete
MKKVKDINLNAYKPFRKKICKLIDKDLLSEKTLKQKEMNIFVKLYRSNGRNCTYLLALCKAIHKTNPKLYERLGQLKG